MQSAEPYGSYQRGYRDIAHAGAAQDSGALTCDLPWGWGVRVTAPGPKSEGKPESVPCLLAHLGLLN